MIKNSLDSAYIKEETEKLGIRSFEETNRSLALHLFRNEPLNEAEQEMLEYMVLSGVYGNFAIYVRQEIEKKGRWRYVRSRMTLPLDVMKRLYPILNRAPLLYPFCWAHRLIRASLFRGETVMYELKSVLRRKG